MAAHLCALPSEPQDSKGYKRASCLVRKRALRSKLELQLQGGGGSSFEQAQATLQGNCGHDSGMATPGAKEACLLQGWSPTRMWGSQTAGGRGSRQGLPHGPRRVDHRGAAGRRHAWPPALPMHQMADKQAIAPPCHPTHHRNTEPMLCGPCMLPTIVLLCWECVLSPH